MRLLAVVLAVFVGVTAGQRSYARAPLRPIAPYRYSASRERVSTQGRITTQNYFGGSSSDPCNPTPCGPNTRCLVSNSGVAQCRCQVGYVPKVNTILGCDLQCRHNDDCSEDHRCSNNECVRVCGAGACASNANCEAYNHAPKCSCPPNHGGDPYSRCIHNEPESRAPPPATIPRPCSYEPCGLYADCREEGDRPVCSCPLGFEGNPLTECRRGECLNNADCPNHKVCQSLKCIDPCTETDRPICGRNAECRTRHHQPICSCPHNYVGDATQECNVFDPEELCHPSPCGRNTNCRVKLNRAVCSCIGNYIGDPLTGCRPECTDDSDCPHNMACRNNICINPCAGLGVCGEGAYCNVKNRRAECNCPKYFLGTPYNRCYTECTKHNDCSDDMACKDFRCVDPCIGACGFEALCKADNHTAICSCKSTYTGDPFDRCRPFTDADYCRSNPCGDNADCQVGFDRDGNKRPVCTCPVRYIGNPLISCQLGECENHDECPNSKACYQYQCKNSCYTSLGDSVCGEDALCYVKNHMPVCSCPPGYTGSPTERCFVEDRSRGNRYVAGYSNY